MIGGLGHGLTNLFRFISVNTMTDSYLRWLVFSVSILVSMAGTILAESESRPQQRPNIIYIMLDDAGYGDFGAFGSSDIQTPTFDQMCREGLRFTHHYSGSAVCAPTRCVLMTGLHSGRCKRRDNKATANQQELPNGLVFLDKSDMTVAKFLQQQGYVTGGIGKWGLGNSGTAGAPDKQGFDHFLGYLDQVHAHNHYTDWLWNDGEKMMLPGNSDGKQETYVHDVLEKDTLEFVRQHANQEKPFFLYLPYTLPHGKYVIPAEDPCLKLYAEKGWNQTTKNYAAMVTRADQTVGKLMDLLKELKIDENTIVFYTSDNGPNAPFAKSLKSGGPFRGIKRQLTEGGLRAAMVARWPNKIPADRTSEFVWSMVDVFPTCAELANADVPKTLKLDGRSVVPTLLGEPQKAHEYLYFEIHHPFQQAVRIGEFKAIRFGTKESVQLFNVVTDPGEKDDVSDQHLELVKLIEYIMVNVRTDSKYYPTVEKAKTKKKRKSQQTP